MSALSDIKPTTPRRIIDLVEDAGIDISDWRNIKGGKERAAVNPKYCYEWSFVEAGKVVVLNLWHELIIERDGTLTQQLNMKETASRPTTSNNQVVWARRAHKMDDAIREAYNSRLPVRVVVCDGKRRTNNDTDTKPSRVKARLLDPIAWAVTSYNSKTGESVLTRGVSPGKFVDQFAIRGELERPTKRRLVSGYAFDRSSEVRNFALMRASGKCELCETPGFKMADGRIYLERFWIEITHSLHG
jgi:5-methylcytosine-specific restriction protein A